MCHISGCSVYFVQCIIQYYQPIQLPVQVPYRQMDGEISIREAKHSVPISFDFRPVLAVMLRVSPDLSNLLYWGCKNQGWYLGYWQYEGEEDDLEDEWLELGGTTLQVVVMVLLLQQVGCFIQNIPSPRVTCQTYLVGRWKPK